MSAACYEHRHHLNTPSRRQFLLDLLYEQCLATDLTVFAWVVLTNHYHLLVQVDKFEALGEIFRRAHGRTAHDWNWEDQAPGRKIWYRYGDRAMRSEGHHFTTLNYVHYNPVKHGLATSPYDWVRSSVHGHLEHKGREWLRDLWRRYPLRDYGVGWDDV